MVIEIEVKNDENIRFVDDKGIEQIQDVVNALVTTGGLTGVKGGQTIIHFDKDGIFQKVELKYFPYYNRKLNM